MATKVKLRQKSISKGRKSLYLDFYPPVPNLKTGNTTRREFLGLYITEKAKSAIDKQHNTETLQIAEKIRQKRENQYNKPEIYNEYEQERLRIRELGNRDFVEYYRELAEKRKSSNYDNWMSALKYLETFTGGSLRLTDLNERYLEDFKEYLLITKSNKTQKSTLSINSAVSYFNKIKATLKQAFKDGILQTDLNSKVTSIKYEETRREYLTLDELQILLDTHCETELVKRAALFSALTGIRFVDIEKMIWSEIEYIHGQGYFVKYKQKKTDGVETQPISAEAYGFTNGTDNPNEMPQMNKVFDGLNYSSLHRQVKKWITDAGITKKISFHNFRHTFATLQLFHGTDIYTVSKMLGHKNLQTTQIYTKVVDEAKIAAANRIQIGKSEK
jgi:integrase